MTQITLPRTRLDLLDVLRGFAILGIFVINLPLMSSTEMTFPTLEGWDALAQGLADLVFEGTQRGLLQLLFGAGLVIVTARAAMPEGPVSVADGYLRRNFWLVGFGLAHIFVVGWGYDVLHVYGLAAVFLFTFRGLSARAAIGTGLAITGVMMLLPMGGIMDPDAKPIVTLPGPDAVTAWLETVSGLNLWATLAEAFATMLIGMGLYKAGILQGARGGRLYLGLVLAGYGLGLSLRLWAGETLAEIARLSMTLGHVGLINLAWKSAMGARVLAPLKAAGRMAFSLYVLQSVIGIWVLWAPWGPLTSVAHGPALDMVAALLVIAFQIALANLWLRRFEMGPLELAWRKLVALSI